MSLGESAWYAPDRAAFLVRRSLKEQSPMYMSVVAPVPGVSIYPELAGARVLITGLTSSRGVDVARAFADHKTRIVLQSSETSPAMTELVAHLAEHAADIKFFNEPIADNPTRFAQCTVGAFSGFDTIVNLIDVSPDGLTGDESAEDIEAFVSVTLLPATLITRVAVNRMSLTWNEGSILNVGLMAAPRNEREQVVADLARTTLAVLTKGEAKAASTHAVRINAVGPRAKAAPQSAGAVLASDPEIASLALHLASKNGRQLTGHIFDAEQVVMRSN